MNIIEIPMTITRAFGNLYRNRCVLVAVENGEGKILLGAKPMFFPPTITRLLGGGVDDGEDILDAAKRELQEELNVDIDLGDLREVALFKVSAVDAEGKEFHNDTYVYHVNIGDKTYTAGDDVKGIDVLTLEQLTDLAESYERLPDCLWYKGVEGEYSWADYGKMYSVIHRTVAQEIARHRVE